MNRSLLQLNVVETYVALVDNLKTGKSCLPLTETRPEKKLKRFLKPESYNHYVFGEKSSRRNHNPGYTLPGRADRFKCRNTDNGTGNASHFFLAKCRFDHWRFIGVT
jgi:hypothetical protein